MGITIKNCGGLKITLKSIWYGELKIEYEPYLWYERLVIVDIFEIIPWLTTVLSFSKIGVGLVQIFQWFVINDLT